MIVHITYNSNLKSKAKYFATLFFILGNRSANAGTERYNAIVVEVHLENLNFHCIGN